MEKIAIIGGGWAGLTSALLLSEKNEVHLFESSANLGGRARSFKQKDYIYSVYKKSFLKEKFKYDEITQIKDFDGTIDWFSFLDADLAVELLSKLDFHKTKIKNP